MLAVAACRPEFQLKNLTTNEALYTASLNEFQHKRWDNAVSGFEKLTTDLSARDSLLPRSYWYLASAHERLGEHLLAAQSFSRLVESFPEDSLADDAALESSRAYRRLWRKPQLDPMYGETAIASYNTLIGLYPTSPLIPVAQKEIAELENWLAIKDYDAGMYYFRQEVLRLRHDLFQGRADEVRDVADGARCGAAAGRVVQGGPLSRRRRRAVRADPRAVPERSGRAARCATASPSLAAAKPDSIPPAAGQASAARALSLRIGLLGGSFDPPHNGHLLAAGDAFDALSLDRVDLHPGRGPATQGREGRGDRGAAAEHGASARRGR